jgi:hypothetical protein
MPSGVSISTLTSRQQLLEWERVRGELYELVRVRGDQRTREIGNAALFERAARDVEPLERHAGHLTRKGIRHF